jgi:hypothetical protein
MDGNDPDLSRLARAKNEPFTGFLDDQWKRDYPADSRIMSPGALDQTVHRLRRQCPT